MKKMKFVALMMTFVILFSVGCGAGSSDESSSKEDDEVVNENVSFESSESSGENKDKVSSTEQKVDGILIKGKYFTLTLPESWAEQYYQGENENAEEYYIEFSEKTSSKDGYGGWLFSIGFYKGVMYYAMPSYNYIGQIEADGKEYSVVVMWPTDVQFTEETADAYMALYETCEDVVNSIEANDGVKFTKCEDIFGWYVFPGSHMRYIEAEEIDGYSAEELRVGRNEIYARHGLKFKSPELREHFEKTDWYKGTVDNVDDIKLNDYEKANIKVIKTMEDKLK